MEVRVDYTKPKLGFTSAGRRQKEMFTTNKIEYWKLKCQQTHASMRRGVLEFLHMDLAH